MQRHESSIYTDYGQLLVLDGNDQEYSTAAIENISNGDLSTRIKLAANIVVVYTQRYGHCRIIVEVDDKKPEIDLHAWDHVVEGSLYVPSGKVEVMSLYPGPGCFSFKIVPCCYRVRVHLAGLDSIHQVENGNEHSDDRYLLSLWPSEPDRIAILKQHPLC